MQPLLKYRGGKRREIPNFRNFIPQNYTTYIEPFFGGGALFFDLAPTQAIINDVRWNFNYIGVDDEEITEDATGTKIENIKLRFTLNGDVIRWNVLRRAINAKLSSDADDIRAHEDKLIGPFFVKCDQYTLDQNDIISTTAENDDFLSVFCEKVLMYLFEDVARTRRDELFEGIKGKCSRYSEVKAAFMKDGLKIFGRDFKTKYYDTEENEYDAKKVREGV